jgi:hypothetical protein
MLWSGTARWGPVERPLGLSAGAESLAPQSVLQSANGVPHFALELISFAFAFELAVAGYLSSNFLHFALGLLGRALDAIFVHHNDLQIFLFTGYDGVPHRNAREIY